MPKRKAGDEKTPTRSKMEIDGDDDESEDDVDMLDVDFEWFDLDANIDFHGLKTLLRQLFDVDNQLLDLSGLADLLLSQPRLGSTVKCDGEESDPYAFISVVNFKQHAQNKAIQQLQDYLITKGSTIKGMEGIKDLLLGESTNVGVILMERFVNMPHQIVPPLYNVLVDEIGKHITEGALPGPITHYLVVSKSYTEVVSQLDAEEDRPSKKTKAPANSETFYFHVEDEVMQKHALASGGFDYTKQSDDGASDARRTFLELGVKPRGHLILVEADKFPAAVTAIEGYLGGDVAG